MDSASRACIGVDPSPIDIVEDIAELRAWDVDRLGDDQIAMAVVGSWAAYSLSLAWFDPDEMLRMVCTYEIDAPEESLPELHKAIEAANDRLWLGGFNLWQKQGLIAYRYGLTLRGGASATSEQVDAMMRSAIDNCERYFPAFQLIAQDGASAENALAAALLEAAGRA